MVSRWTVAVATVIHETSREAQPVFMPRSSERVNIRELLQKSFVVWNRGRNARLLQHDFRKPDAIGIPGAAPGQVTLELMEPAQQLFAKCGELAAVQHRAGTFSHT